MASKCLFLTAYAHKVSTAIWKGEGGLDSPNSLLKSLSQNFCPASGLWLYYPQSWGSPTHLAEEKACMFKTCVCISVSVNIFTYIHGKIHICLWNAYVSEISILKVLFVFRCINKGIHTCTWMYQVVYQEFGEQNADSHGQHSPSPSIQGTWLAQRSHSCTGVATVSQQDGHRRGTWPYTGWGLPCHQGPQRCRADGAMPRVPQSATSPSQGRRGWGGSVSRLNFIHPSTVSQVAFRIRKSKKYIHRCSLVYLLTLCNLFALICFCLSWDFPF